MRTIEKTIGILLIIGLSLGIGFGFYHEYDGKNLKGLAEFAAETERARRYYLKEMEWSQEQAQRAREAARVASERLAHYQEYVLGKDGEHQCYACKGYWEN